MSMSFLAPRLNNGTITDDFAAEGRARKRFQRAIAESTNSASAMAAQELDRRRITLRENKPPSGPRPLGYSPSKRIPSDAAQRSGGSNRTFLLTSPSESSFGGNSVGDASYFNCGDRSPETNASFFPAVNFDDFHARVTSNTSDPYRFPTPEGFTRTVVNPPSSNHALVGRQVNPEEAAARRASILRRRDPVVRRSVGSMGSPTNTAASAAASLAMSPAKAPLSLRSRQQPQFPIKGPSQTHFIEARKSFNPSIFPKQIEDDLHNVGSEVIGKYRHLDPKAAQLAPSQTHQAMNMKRALTPELSLPSSDERSPNRRVDRRGESPPSSNKRQSIHSHIISGLGARTISPTDARRLKRLTLHGEPSQMSFVPHLPQPDSRPATRTGPSPSLIPRKSVTPSSARETPDRRFYTSSHSLSASSSHNSLRAVARSDQARVSADGTVSKLPMPKGRNVHSRGVADEDEDVPPVPAIPKAYESPYDADQAAIIRQKPTIPRKPLHISNQTDSIPSTRAPAATTDSRHRRGLTVDNGSFSEERPAPPNFARKPIMPMRLPPLNLHLWGTSSTNRIASFPEPSAEVDRRTNTPPSKRSFAKTPSTPMTASKATVYGALKKEEDVPRSLQARSSSFHTASRPDALGFKNFARRETGQHGIANDSSSEDPISPVVPNSNLDLEGDFIVQSPTASSGNMSDDLPSEFRSAKSVISVHNAVSSKSSKASSSAHTSLSTEPETSSSGTSLREKLTFGWRRTSSKSSHRSQKLEDKPHKGNNSWSAEEEPLPQPPKYSDMPPPRLPACATWTGPAQSINGLAGRSIPLPDDQRRKTIISTVPAEAQYPPSNVWTVAQTNHASPDFTHTATVARSSSSSILTPVHKMMRSRSFVGVKARITEGNADRDEIAANDEMKMLASKIKDVEIAARELDELRRRAYPKECVSPIQALQVANLNIFERGEIVDFAEIYFCGSRNAKKRAGDLNAASSNFGYDDERGDYEIVLGDHLAYRYEVIDLLGKGSFGQVVRCVDHKTGLLVAIKIIRNKKRFHQQALVEVNILEKLRKWDPQNKHSMINFTKSFYFRGHLCIATELLGMNLYEFIKAHEFRGFSLKLIRQFTKQMLNALVLLKGHSVIHCDLKPENILLAHPLRSEIKIIDFGSSCFANEQVYTYIQSRFYRSPEVILGLTYGLAIDMWSLACILAELLTGYPIFPGENEQEQLACIMEIFGPPERHLIEKSSRRKLFFDSNGKPRVTVSSKGRRRRPSSKTLQQSLKCDDEAFLDFITRCLRWDPERRLKPEEALTHEFVTGVRKVGRARFPPSAANSSSSPVKRLNNVPTPSRGKQMVETPSTILRHGMAGARRDASIASPVKASGVRRSSTMNHITASMGVKRTSNGAAVTTALTPRLAQRSTSGRPDLAAAAAAASLKMRS